MNEREITNNELEQLFETIIEQAPLIAEDEVNSMLIGLPTANQGSALKRFFQNRLNTILLSASLIVITISVALIWINSIDTAETSRVENAPKSTFIAPVSTDTVNLKNTVVDIKPETIADEVMETVTPTTGKSVEKISVTEASSLPLPKSEPAYEDTLTLENLYQQLEKKPQIFSVRTDRDTVITCDEGTTIKIKANTFINEKTGEPITGNVEVAVKEYYKISDIVLANLTTTSGNRMLESGGMLHIAANSNNENCIIKPGETIEIGFPYQNKKDDMNLFYGKQTENNMEWEFAQTPDDVVIQDELVVEDTEAEVVTYINVSPVTAMREEEEVEEVKTYINVEEMPEFPGGDRARVRWLQRNVKYPRSAFEKGVQGKVYVSFYVGKDGSINDAYVLRGIDSLLDREALRVVKQMPRWRPGKQRGKAVNVTFTIPVIFTMGGEIEVVDDDEITYEFEDEAEIYRVETNSNRMERENELKVYGVETNSMRIERANFEEKVESNNLNENDIVEVNQYLFSTTRLGWINCDRFYKYSKPAVDFFIRTDNADKINVNAIFNNFKGMLQGRYQDGKIHFDRIPEGESMTFVAIKTLNNQIYLAVKETKVTENGEMKLDFQPVTLELLKKEMEKLNELF